ncbi:MAG: biosynthetic-type acetolactate synthase large subunit [Clostridia bacterium]
MKLTGAQIVIEEILKQGTTTVFGYPGGTVLPIYDELYKNSHRINHVLTAHEQGAAHAADGYARVTGKAGVVIATSGPGATNLVTGIANAHLDSIPLVAITGNVAVPLLGKDSFQEVDIGGVTQPIVKHNFVVRHVEDLEHIMEEAFKIAEEGRKGPVLVDIPKDIQTNECEYIGRDIPDSRKTLADFDITKAVKAINSGKKPFIYAGGGVISAKAEKELLELSKKISAPVGLSMMGLTALPASYELNMGMCGMHGKYSSSMASANCDVMIALGVRFSDRATGDIAQYTKNKTIIHVDIDMAEIDKNITSEIKICGDLKKVITALTCAVDENCNDDWMSEIEDYKDVDVVPYSRDFTPHNIIETVNKAMDKDTVIATDVGQHQMWTVQNYKFEKPQRLLTSGGLGTMGFGMGAAIGGCMANNKKRTVLFTSEGSFGMNLNEMATAVSQKLPLVIMMMNNGVLGMVRQWQTMFYDKRYAQTTLNRKTDFVKLADAFGAKSARATNLDELDEILKNLPTDEPILIDCIIDMDEMVLPMIPPGLSVKDIIIEKE